MTYNDPHSLSDPSQAAIKHLDLHLRPDFDERVVHVRAAYRLDRPVDGPFDLDSMDLDIHRVRAGSMEVAWTIEKRDPLLGQRLRLDNLRGADSFEVEVTTSSGAAALQWLRPEQTLGRAHPLLYTQCQACSARSLFPCQDTPSVRFTYEAEIEAPSPLVAVMAAERLDVGRDPRGERFRFAMRQAIPSYLFAFAVGHLAFEAIGPRTGVYGEPEIVSAGAWEYARNEAYLEAGEALFGPYLWDRYDLLLLPPAFPYGGMENPRLTFFNASYVRGDRSGVWLVAHELAHAWTGNLVTNATWNDFWLNEGPTTYAETRLTEALEGEAISRLRTAGRARVLLRDLDRLGHDSPMTRLQVDLAGKDPDESYTNIPYYKGMLLFRALEEATGRPAFDRFLRRYIDAYQFRSIDSEEFLAFLEAELPQAAAQVNVRRWIYEPGLPEGAADVPSALRDELRRAADAFRGGEPLSSERVAGWTSLQRTVFVGMLLPRIAAEACESLDALLGIGDTHDGELFCRFCELSIRSGYRAILPRYEAYFASVGRFSQHQDVFRALVAEAWSRDLARPLFERHRAYHHPHTVAALERILTEAGL